MAKQVIGWREWVALPDWGVSRIKAKIDTGARSSALHAYEVVRFAEDDKAMVAFEIHPKQRSGAGAIRISAEVVDERTVRNPGGRSEVRPVVRTMVRWNGLEWPLDLTLTRRDEMGFRLLLGRQAVRGRAVVDPGRSFLGEKEVRS